jgi:hypothetical protein
VDDPRLSLLWEFAAEHDLPIVIHVGDPPEFWWPLDASNPRRDDLVRQPQSWYGRGGFPPLTQVQDEFERRLRPQDDAVHRGACRLLPRLARSRPLVLLCVTVPHFAPSFYLRS